MLLVLRHRWGEQAHLALSLPPQTPPQVMLRSCKSLRLSIQGFKLWFLFFCVYVIVVTSLLSQLWSVLMEQSNMKLHLLLILLLFHVKEWGWAPAVSVLWLMWPHSTSNPSAASLCLCTAWPTCATSQQFFKETSLEGSRPCFFGEHGVEGGCGRSEMSSGLQGQGAN